MKVFSGDKLRKLRLKRGLRLEDVSAATGLKKGLLSHYETGRVKPPADNLLTLLDLYKATNREVADNPV